MKLTFDVPEGLAEKIAEDIKVALKEYKNGKIWPKKGDHYYFIISDSSIAYDSYDDLYVDIDRFRLGNCFRTKEEAEFKLEQLRVLHELEQLADDDQPWRDCYHAHYYLYYDYTNDALNINYDCYCKSCQFYFKSNESAQAAIDKIGAERLKKYYFCIPEVEE